MGLKKKKKNSENSPPSLLPAFFLMVRLLCQTNADSMKRDLRISSSSVAKHGICDLKLVLLSIWHRLDG